jgi:tetratricopeptide (TPR) repeat protein
MVGRDEELVFLANHLEEAISGKGGLTLISGEAGIGKTRLAKEFEGRAETRGCKVLVGNCVPSAQIPYLVFLDALRCLSNEKNQSRAVRFKNAAKRASPDLVGAIPVVGGTARALAALIKEYQREDGSGSKENLLFGTLELFKAESEQNPLIIHLDDLQWADSASIGMLHFLARNVRDSPIFLLGTYRTEEVLSREEEVHPFLDSLQVMRREGIVKEVNLHPLAESETQLVVSGMLQRPVQKMAIDCIFNESGGSPLFTVETLRMLVSEGRLVERNGTYVMVGEGEIHIPRTIQEVISRRMDKLSKGQRKILECASVIGERFDLHLLFEALGIDELQLLDNLEAISKNFQLVAWDEDNFKFTHARIRDVTYDAILKPKQVELHKRVGSSLEKRLPDSTLLGALSWHFDRAHANEKCIKYSLQAGKYCSARKAVIEAKSFYQLVLAKTENDPNLVAERLEALEGLGDIGAHQSTAKEWYSYYEQFLELNRDQKARARVLAKAGECWDQMGLIDIVKANEFLDEAESLAEGDPRILGFIERERGDLYGNDGNWIEQQAHMTKSRQYYEMAGDSKGVITCKIHEGNALFERGRLPEAKAIAEELLCLARKLEDPELFADVEFWNAEINAWIGETELAKTQCTEVIQLTDKLGLMWQWRNAVIFRAWAKELEGDFESARNDMLKELEIEKMHESNLPWIGFCEILLGLYESELGLKESAKSRYEDGLRKLTPVSEGKRGSIYITVLLAELLAAEGNYQKSDDAYNDAIKLSAETDYWLELVDCRSRYGVSLARREMQEQARIQFDEAMEAAKKAGCEKRVQIYAKRVGIALYLN